MVQWHSVFLKPWIISNFFSSFELDYQFKSSFSYNPFQNSLGNFNLEEGRMQRSSDLYRRWEAEIGLPAYLAPHHQFITIVFEREAVFFLNLGFSKAGKRGDLISAVAGVESKLVHVPKSIQPRNPT